MGRLQQLAALAEVRPLARRAAPTSIYACSWIRRRTCNAAQRLALADVPDVIATALRLGRMVALRKPNGRVRGLVMGDTFRRLVARTLAQQFAASFDAACPALPVRARDLGRNGGAQLSLHFMLVPSYFACTLSLGQGDALCCFGL